MLGSDDVVVVIFLPDINDDEDVFIENIKTECSTKSGEVGYKQAYCIIEVSYTARSFHMRMMDIVNTSSN